LKKRKRKGPNNTIRKIVFEQHLSISFLGWPTVWNALRRRVLIVIVAGERGEKRGEKMVVEWRVRGAVNTDRCLSNVDVSI
jgi:hypothetical protein